MPQDGREDLTWLGLSAFGISGVKAPRTVDPKTVFDLLKIVFAAVAGVGGVVALVMAYRRKRVAEASNQLAEIGASLDKERERREQARHLNERFTTASSQLGDENAAVRLAGVYAPAALAWAHDREVRHTIGRVIAAHLRQNAALSWQGHDCDFTTVVFDGGDFTGSHFSAGQVRFGYTEFESGRVDFRGAVFEGATVHFGFAEFTGGFVDFRGRIDFGNARFNGATVRLDQAEFAGATVDLSAVQLGAKPPVLVAGGVPQGLKLPKSRQSRP
ncbi:hypothetical protein AB0C12_02945 [Actinoplanes sp. NPDC048967]|uniref:hypothetical protein n=1 Tax=Actinoplanes sp. NPDC048967 TaxID=3155269 RepID=UPI00340C0043